MRGTYASVVVAVDAFSPEPVSPARKLLVTSAMLAPRTSQQPKSQNDCFMCPYLSRPS